MVYNALVAGFLIKNGLIKNLTKQKRKAGGFTN